MVIRPFFLQLLENNPKLAGQKKKQEATATQMMPRVVCFVHNIIQVRVTGPAAAAQHWMLPPSQPATSHFKQQFRLACLQLV